MTTFAIAAQFARGRNNTGLQWRSVPYFRRFKSCQGLTISPPLDTQRCQLREATLQDAEFMLQLLNEPSWRKYIARHDISTIQDAENYLLERIIPAYATGLGFWVVELKEKSCPVGVCGLVKRPFLSEVDLGFALLEQFWGLGIAYEAAQAVINYARSELKLTTLQAITVPYNDTSIQLLEKLNFASKELITDEEGEELKLYELKLIAERNINLLNK